MTGGEVQSYKCTITPYLFYFSSLQASPRNQQPLNQTMTTTNPTSFVVLGAGVIGLTTALVLHEEYPNADITILAQYFPGDYHVDYCSPWAGGNWCSSANDNGVLEQCDWSTFLRFDGIVKSHPEAGIRRSPLRMIFDQEIEHTDILSQGTNKIWYDEMVGGLVDVPDAEVPQGAKFGKEMPSTFVINTQIYLQW